MEITEVFLRRKREKGKLTARMVVLEAPQQLTWGGPSAAEMQQNWFLVLSKNLGLGNLVGIVRIFEHPTLVLQSNL